MSWECVFNGTEQIGVVCKQYKFEEIAWVRDIVHVNQKKKWAQYWALWYTSGNGLNDDQKEILILI